MSRKLLAFVAVALLGSVLAAPALADRGRNPNPSVVIDIAEVVFDNGIPSVLILRGDQFRNNVGRVLLDGVSLPILSWSNKTIEAEIPEWVVPATYRVTVTKGAASIDNFSMDVYLGSGGPQGPPGPPGSATFYSRSSAATTTAAQLEIGSNVSCDSGDVAVGGGVSWSQGSGAPATLVRSDSKPTPTLTAWTGVLIADAQGSPFPAGTTIDVTVVCADMTP